MNREMLEKPFDKSVIKKRKGRGGEIWDYVAAAYVIKRLNDSFDGNWSFEVVKNFEMGEEIIVLGKLTAEGVTKMQFGGKNHLQAQGWFVCVSCG